MTTTTTRRALLKAAPAATLLTVIPTISAFASAGRTEWERAMSALAKIEAEDAAFTPGWRRIARECRQACERIPHIKLRPDPYSGSLSPITTSDQFFVNRARKTVADVEAGKMFFEDIPELQDHLQLCRDVADAVDNRDQRVQTVRDSYNMDALDDRAEDIGNRLADAAERLMSMPAPDLAALRWKIDYLTDGNQRWDGWDGDYAKATLADIIRIMPEAA